MNYIKEINAFHARQETDPLTMSAAYLWMVLMDINNRAGWKKQFSVAVSLLCGKTGLKESNFKRARNELKEKGYIHMQSQGANRASQYQMISLVDYAEKVHDDKDDVIPADTGDHSNDYTNVHTSDRTNGALFKQNETKQKEDNTTNTALANVVCFYEDNFIKSDQDNPLNPYLEGSLFEWTLDMGETLVLTAMERALDQNKGTWGYTKGILQLWKKEGVRTLNDVQEDDEELRQKKVKQSRSSRRLHRTPTNEVVPDWFRERKRKQETLSKNQAVMSLSAEELAREKAEVEALLKRHSSSG